jgi:hypothetical protein
LALWVHHLLQHAVGQLHQQLNYRGGWVSRALPDLHHVVGNAGHIHLELVVLGFRTLFAFVLFRLRQLNDVQVLQVYHLLDSFRHEILVVGGIMLLKPFFDVLASYKVAFLSEHAGLDSLKFDFLVYCFHHFFNALRLGVLLLL